jgi:hypothetical protein
MLQAAPVALKGNKKCVSNFDLKTINKVDKEMRGQLKETDY